MSTSAYMCALAFVCVISKGCQLRLIFVEIITMTAQSSLEMEEKETFDPYTCGDLSGAMLSCSLNND